MTSFRDKVKYKTDIMFNFFQGKKPPVEQEVSSSRRFFSLEVSEKIVQAALWEVEQNVKVLAKSETKPYFNETDLLVKLDQCLQELGPEGQSVQQTFFHLDSSFFDQNGLLKEKKPLFENITESLQLTSLGFITNTEAVINAKIEQNPQLDKQLVVEFINNKTIFSLYQKKNLLDQYIAEAETDFVTQFKTALVQMAGQIGIDYSGFFIDNNDELAPSPEEKAPIFVNFISSLLPTLELQEKVELLPTTLPMRAEILGSDIILSYILIPRATILAKSYGWILGDDDLEENSTDQPPIVPAETIKPRISQQESEFIPTIEENEFIKPKKFSFLKPDRKLALLAFFLALFSLVMIAFFFLFSQTKVTLSLVPEKSVLTKSLEVIIDPKLEQSDYDKLVLPGEVVVKNLQHEYIFTATGLREVGDSAKGEVELINKTTEERKFGKGTQVGDGTVSFSLDNEVTVPATNVSSNDSGEVRSYGKSKVSVTANAPGTRSNLGQDINLKIESLSIDRFEAKTTKVFTGGTDKTATVFSKEDSENAIKGATKELSDKMLAEIGAQESGKYFAVQADKLKITKQTFDQKLNEEANEVTLSLQATVPVIIYELSELTPLAQATLQKELPAGYELMGDTPDVLSAVNQSKTNKDGERIYLTVNLSQATASILDLETIESQILGQPLFKADNFLSSFPGIKTHHWQWNNKFYSFISKKIPKDARKVEVVRTLN